MLPNAQHATTSQPLERVAARARPADHTTRRRPRRVDGVAPEASFRYNAGRDVAPPGLRGTPVHPQSGGAP